MKKLLDNEKILAVEEKNTDCELTENDLDQVNGGLNYKKACVGGICYGVGAVLIGTGIGAPVGGALCSLGAGLFLGGLTD